MERWRGLSERTLNLAIGFGIMGLRAQFRPLSLFRGLARNRPSILIGAARANAACFPFVFGD